MNAQTPSPRLADQQQGGTGLNLQHVAVGYDRGKRRERTILRDITTTVSQGDLIGLVGPNGAGKSTLLRTIAGLQPPLAGSITVAGFQVGSTPKRVMAKVLAAVLTDRSIGGRLRVHEVVALGRYPHSGLGARLDDQDRAVMARALNAVGASALWNRDVTELSDGQRQRVLVARALAQEPMVMVLDEPTAFLDPPGRIALLELLREVSTEQAIAMVVCTHDVDLMLHYADRFWIAGPGEVVHIGDPDTTARDGTLETAFQTDGVIFDHERARFISTRMAQALDS
ncbi:ABC transporter ATP-binding protein [Stomatohabitans albus]|uniref:ABC transporter ATP-binding protein n=1 Tax=Stomatohabitans albus TaxID=3110766 RepID=UPI00300C4031